MCAASFIFYSFFHHHDNWFSISSPACLDPNIPVLIFLPNVVSYVCVLKMFMFIPVMCFCPFLFVFHPVIQFESTRSSSPTECCHFSPWSRKVLVPSLPSATPNTLFHLSALTDLFLSLFKCMPSLSLAIVAILLHPVERVG